MSAAPLFTFATAAEAAAWQSIDDVVMGGVSQSRMEFVSPRGARFTGTVSLEHGGGCASVRAAGLALDLSDREGISPQEAIWVGYLFLSFVSVGAFVLFNLWGIVRVGSS